MNGTAIIFLYFSDPSTHLCIVACSDCQLLAVSATLTYASEPHPSAPSSRFLMSINPLSPPPLPPPWYVACASARARVRAPGGGGGGADGGAGRGEGNIIIDSWTRQPVEKLTCYRRHLAMLMRAAYQAAAGDFAGARATQRAFTQTCPLVAPVTARWQHKSFFPSLTSQATVFKQKLHPCPVLPHSFD